MPRQYVAVVGSREFADLEAVTEYVNSLPNGTVLVTGDARGVDSVAFAAAARRKMERYQLKPCWGDLGNAAGPLRNEGIVRMCDTLTAFWDGTSSGTKDVVATAQRYGRPVEIVRARP